MFRYESNSELSKKLINTYIIIATSDLTRCVGLSLTAVEAKLTNLDSGFLKLTYPDNS